MHAGFNHSSGLPIRRRADIRSNRDDERGFLAQFGYDSGQRLRTTQMSVGGIVPGPRTTRTYTARSQIDTIVTQSTVGTVAAGFTPVATLASYDYGYDAGGRRRTLAQPNLGFTITWGYDLANRLTGESWTANGGVASPHLIAGK